MKCNSLKDGFCKKDGTSCEYAIGHSWELCNKEEHDNFDPYDHGYDREYECLLCELEGHGVGCMGNKDASQKAAIIEAAKITGLNVHVIDGGIPCRPDKGLIGVITYSHGKDHGEFWDLVDKLHTHNLVKDLMKRQENTEKDIAHIKDAILALHNVDGAIVAHIEERRKEG